MIMTGTLVRQRIDSLPTRVTGCELVCGCIRDYPLLFLPASRLVTVRFPAVLGFILARLTMARDKSGKSPAQGQFALLRALPRGLRSPTNQDLAQIADGNIDGCCKIDLAVSDVVDSIVAQRKYFGGHSSPHESSWG
ncbi:MAG: hypothetical protein QOJ15_7636, partial [Bradyrhizobium sp.]|nr:hypothetical protein [Bradyrhizobium sp.]